MIERITSVSTRSRGLLLLPVGAFVVHQLRYRIAYGPHADAQLQAQGHSYLDSFAPWLVLLLCLAAGSFLARVAQAAATGRAERRRHSFGSVWAASSGTLMAVYAVQELLEGFVAAGHPAGFHGIVGHGGWWAGVLAVVVGAAIGLLLRVAGAVVDAAARAFHRRRPSAAAVDLPQAQGSGPRPRPLALAQAGRAPPLSFA
ncbi:MAG TPA: hypothetical protein VLK36_00950 [Gaiellaceae bacterium]|nr:hypothetical protein [Gaiellaceae bacterium]